PPHLAHARELAPLRRGGRHARGDGRERVARPLRRRARTRGAGGADGMRLFGGGGAKREERAFDRVVVLGEDGSAERTLTPAEFHTLGLDERVRLILGKRL